MDAYTADVADAWLKMNRPDLGRNDMVTKMLYGIQPPLTKNARILEIGCSNGWRLKKIKEAWGCHVAGIDLSPQGIREAREVTSDCCTGSAHKLPWADNSFDIVIHAFELSCIPPDLLLQAVAESDRVLRLPGLLLIHDYFAPVNSKVKLDHSNPHWFHFCDFRKLWTAHPNYTHLATATESLKLEGVALLGKDEGYASPVKGDK